MVLKPRNLGRSELNGLKGALHDLARDAVAHAAELRKVVALAELSVAQIARGAGKDIRHAADPVRKLVAHASLHVGREQAVGGADHRGMAVEVEHRAQRLAALSHKAQHQGLIVKRQVGIVAVGIPTAYVPREHLGRAVDELLIQTRRRLQHQPRDQLDIAGRGGDAHGARALKAVGARVRVDGVDHDVLARDPKPRGEALAHRAGRLGREDAHVDRYKERPCALDLEQEQRRTRRIVHARRRLLADGMDIALHPKRARGSDIDRYACSLHGSPFKKARDAQGAPGMQCRYCSLCDHVAVRVAHRHKRGRDFARPQSLG